MNEQAQQITIEKSFSVSKDDLYKAWTEESQLRQWWKPMNKEMVKVENDIREGGSVAYLFSNDLKIHGQYKEVQAGEKLMYSWIWELPGDSHHKGEYLLTVVFNGSKDGSQLQVTQEDFKSEHSVQPHEEGWGQALEDLKAYLERNK